MEVLLEALHQNPADDLAWRALADWLEEHGQTQQAELLRLVCQLRVQPHSGGRRKRQTWARINNRVAELLGLGVPLVLPELVNSIGLRLALVPAGVFLMGLPESPGLASCDCPQHEVEITRPFYLGIFPVTQAQWCQVMGDNPSHFRATSDPRSPARGMDTSNFPVEQVDWEACQVFLQTLSLLGEERKAGRNYRLPTEAEWEYACCGGPTGFSQQDFNCAWSRTRGEKGMYLERTSRVGKYLPNAFGLYDMHGNVDEWCADWFAEGYYRVSPREDPPGPADGSERVWRGGSWRSISGNCRSTARNRAGPAVNLNTVGFRVALTHQGRPG
jgi:uncharacterized protein (TIGR02996 family)